MSTEATYSTHDPPALQIQNWKKKFIFFHSIEKQTHQNVVRTAVMHLALPCVPHFDVVCDLLLNRPTDRFQSRDHFTIGRHIGAHVNSELVSREL